MVQDAVIVDVTDFFVWGMGPQARWHTDCLQSFCGVRVRECGRTASFQGEGGSGMAEEKGKGTYNVVVIGAGTAGLVTAAGTAGLGGRVALIERHKMGGDCLNYGCVPSKALISSARAIEHIRQGRKWGLEPQEPQFEFTRVFERMRERRAVIEPNDSRERFEGLGVDVFSGEAQFASSNAVVINGDTTLQAKHFVIATGRRAGIPPIEGIDGVPYFTNETIFDHLNEKPQSMVVIGGGPIGCELSQALSRLGVRVTVVEFLPRIMVKEDPDVAAFMRKQLEAEGIRVLTGAAAKRAQVRDGHVHLEVLQKTPGNGEGETLPLQAQALLIAAGRIPNVEPLNLDAAGVRFNTQGIEVNNYLQTLQPHIYAAGDVVGPYQFTHMADAQARVVIRNILMPFQALRQKVDYSVVPWCTYTSPEVARVGLSETEAGEQKIAYDLFTQPLDDMDRAIVESEEAGFAKVLTEKGSDKILGVTLVSEHAGDLLHEFVLAMSQDIGLGAIASTVHAYPTFAELARKMGDQYNRTRLTPRVKSIFRWLYRKRRGI